MRGALSGIIAGYQRLRDGSPIGCLWPGDVTRLEETRPEEDGQREQEGRDNDVPGQFLDVQADLSAVHHAGNHGGHGALDDECAADLSLIHISEPTRLGMISYAVF